MLWEIRFTEIAIYTQKCLPKWFDIIDFKFNKGNSQDLKYTGILFERKT